MPSTWKQPWTCSHVSVVIVVVVQDPPANPWPSLAWDLPTRTWPPYPERWRSVLVFGLFCHWKGQNEDTHVPRHKTWRGKKRFLSCHHILFDVISISKKKTVENLKERKGHLVFTNLPLSWLSSHRMRNAIANLLRRPVCTVLQMEWSLILPNLMECKAWWDFDRTQKWPGLHYLDCHKWHASGSFKNIHWISLHVVSQVSGSVKNLFWLHNLCGKQTFVSN